jgi:hypothetical protein
MLIDCDACGVRGSGCADCVISALVGAPPAGVELTELPAGVELDEVENTALRALVSAGLDPEFLSITAAAEPDQGKQSRADWLGARHSEEERARRRAG